MSLEYYLEKLRNLNMNRRGSRKSPHKVCMLLAVMDLIKIGVIASNRIKLDQVLKDQFTVHFNNLSEGKDKNTPENPYFHLKSEGFWHLVYEENFDAFNTNRYSAKAISYAYLDDELFHFMKSSIVSNELKDALVSNLSDLAALYFQWLIDIGKKEKTAENYSKAVRFSISKWLKDAGEIREPITDIGSYRQFLQVEEKARQLDTFKRHDSKGNGMYSAALSSYHKFLVDLAQVDVNADIRQVMSDDNLTDTEKKILVSTRIGQGIFRTQLIQLWRKCAVTGYKNTQILIASHIKPWRASSNEERLDKYNGLLLLANLDKAFDLGFISFDEHGRVMIASDLENPEIIGVSEGMSFEIRNEHKKYLAYHRAELFKGL
ncbi:MULTISPECIES: HNH endonuclease [Vibrio]|uniref:HNH nuclease domain-containing protein n=2 Tax=Vibrio TaxID=662 RepID=U3B799_VIBPR|nr:MULTISPECIES: HNH endonuclease [Vibrio]NAW56271.1 HNH endonuclease [Vibrio sp. V36_P2S2PM302]NAX26974.1 HNH endonuclease [Vibrio sp. V38_P2S17PM301]NAX28619.1 HNH endonuclease [Vibrio sp. V37_P2S8PM304]GAD65729.1 hypothetical protein VPR01S_01_05030 [Vibrio proteolyticus NBRC 13287]